MLISGTLVAMKSYSYPKRQGLPSVTMVLVDCCILPFKAHFSFILRQYTSLNLTIRFYLLQIAVDKVNETRRAALEITLIKSF